MDITGIILAGGESSRMGSNKALLDLHNKKVVEHIASQLQKCSNRVLIVTNNKEEYRFLKIPLLSDRFQKKGPLAGIETALYHEKADVYLFAACDMPFINCEIYNLLIKEIQDYNAVIPVFQNRIHPLSGVYKRTVLPYVQELIENDQLRVRNLFKHIHVKYIEGFNLPHSVLKKHFFNMNYPLDYDEAKRL